ncbi:MAG: hypothetical protein ACK5KO_12480 [Arachnia sp.]
MNWLLLAVVAAAMGAAAAFGSNPVDRLSGRQDRDRRWKPVLRGRDTAPGLPVRLGFGVVLAAAVLVWLPGAGGGFLAVAGGGAAVVGLGWLPWRGPQSGSSGGASNAMELIGVCVEAGLPISEAVRVVGREAGDAADPRP